MSDLHAYLASDELAAALAEHHAERKTWQAKVAAWDDAHPLTKLLFRKSGFTMDREAIGFTDGAPDSPPPSGLSRAQTRVELIPRKRIKAGEAWQAVLDEINDGAPMVEPIFSRFGVPSSMWVGQGISPTQYADAGEDGWLVVNLYALSGDGGQFHKAAGDPLAHLTPIPLSEFYRIKERLEAERVGAES
jgi:hypothetical protein